MTNAKPTRSTWRISAAALLCGTALPAAPAVAQTIRSGLEVSATAEAVSNPYLDSDSNALVGAGSIDLRPWIERRSDTDTLLVEGFLRLRGFTADYDLEDSYGGSLRASSKVSTRTNAYGTLDVRSSNSRSQISSFARLPGIGDPINPTDPIPVSPIGDDLTLIGVPGRSTSINLQAGLNTALNERASAGARVAYQKAITDGNFGADYDSVTIGGNYSRRLNERTSIGFGSNLNHTRYQGRFPDSTTIDASAQFDYRAATYWSLNATAGLATTRTEASSFGPADSTLFAIGSVSGCYRPQDQSFCLTGSRSQQPTARGGTVPQTSVGLSMSQRLSARDRFDAGASYSRSGIADAFSIEERSLEVVSLRASLSRSFSDRLDGYIFGSGSRAYDDSLLLNRLTDKPSLAFGAGVRLRLGSIR